jgi:hypothetical protein
MSANDLPTRLGKRDDGRDPDSILTRLERLETAFDQTVREFSFRLLMLEHRTGSPLSYVERVVVENELKRRQEFRDAARARDESFRQAKAEAEATGDRAPIDAFVRRLHAGVFEPPASKPNGG